MVLSGFKQNKFHVHQCQAQIEIWRSPDIHLALTWASPDHLTIIWPSIDPYMLQDPYLT